MFDKLTNLISWGGPTTIIIIVIFALIFAASLFWGIKHRAKKEKVTSAAIDVPAKKTKKKAAVIEAEEPEETEAEETEFNQLRGTGKYKAMVYCYDGISVDFTTIPERLGNTHTFDVSLPQPGGNYIVKELVDGSLAAYDPRDTVMETKETPDWVWLAINCKQIIQNFWRVPNAWWKSVGMWFAAAVLLVDFICFLAVFGG